MLVLPALLDGDFSFMVISLVVSGIMTIGFVARYIMSDEVWTRWEVIAIGVLGFAASCFGWIVWVALAALLAVIAIIAGIGYVGWWVCGKLLSI